MLVLVCPLIWLHAIGLKSALDAGSLLDSCFYIWLTVVGSHAGSLLDSRVLSLKSVGPGCLGVGLLFGGFWFGLVGAWSSRLFVFSIPCMRDVHAICLWDLVPFFKGVCSR
jgi:hypothetical protein